MRPSSVALFTRLTHSIKLTIRTTRSLLIRSLTSSPPTTLFALSHSTVFSMSKPPSTPTGWVSSYEDDSSSSTASSPDKHYSPAPYAVAASTLRRNRRKRAINANHVPRPPNSFILFRRQFSDTHRGEASDGETISMMASRAWKELSYEARAVYEDMAAQAKREHAVLHPNYVYRPKRNATIKPKLSKARCRLEIHSGKSLMLAVTVITD